MATPAGASSAQGPRAAGAKMGAGGRPACGNGRAAREEQDGERRGIGKDAYRESRDEEGDSDATILNKLLEKNFRIFFLSLAIHGDFHK